MDKKKFKEIHELMSRGEVSSVDLVRKNLNKIKRYEGTLNSFTFTADEKELLKQAEMSDKRRKEEKLLSPLDGVPIAVKDNIHVQGMPTSCGSRVLGEYFPPYEATVVKRLKNGGAIIIGKTNMDEFAMGSTTETSYYGTAKNPWDTSKVCGGSSGGSACAVSAGFCQLALGSDTGGSIRQPAAFCGIAGLKPTYGGVSRYGLTAYASSFDQIGPMSNDVYGMTQLYSVIAGHDKNDSTSVVLPYEKIDINDGYSLKGKKIAVVPQLYEKGISDSVYIKFKEMIDFLRELGCEIYEVKLSCLDYLVPVYYFLASAEAGSNLSRYDGVKYGYRGSMELNYQDMLKSSRAEGFGFEVKKRILLGNFVLSSGYYDAYYLKAQKIRSQIREELDSLFKGYDFLLTPTALDTAYSIGESQKDPLKTYLSDITTVIPNLAGIPAVSLPCGLINGLPVGIQLMGPSFSEPSLLNTARVFEENLNERFFPDLDEIDLKEKHEGASSILENKKGGSFNRDDVKKISAAYGGNEKSERIYCEELKNKIGEKVVLMGSIYRVNRLGGIDFYTLKDRTGMTQLVMEKEKTEDKLNVQAIVKVSGTVECEERSPYGNIEINVDEITTLSSSAVDLPIQINRPYNNLNLPTLLDYRTLSVRNMRTQNIFKVQSKLAGLFSEFLRKEKFTEIKTPKIISSGTEGGTNIFEMKYFDRIAYLAQSPQFYKQIMVGSGMERVFEVGPVFRAEHHNSVRHLNEYTSMDFEMAFIENEQDVIDKQEELLKFMISRALEEYGDILSEFNPEEVLTPDEIPRIHFFEALDIAASSNAAMEEGDLTPEGERKVCEYVKKNYASDFVYIIGYPVHKRPFYTMPDERLKGCTRSFDLLFRGLEITTGGQRIHDYYQLRDSILRAGGNPKTFHDYLMTFQYGMPPHGGLGMGLERLTMKLLNLNNIREASLFPRDIGRITP